MDKLYGWLWLVIALMWLLPLVNIDQLGVVSNWIAVIALVIVGVKMLMEK